MPRIRPVIRKAIDAPRCIEPVEIVDLSGVYGLLSEHEREFVGLLERGVVTHDALEAEIWADSAPRTMHESKAVLARNIRAKLKQAGLPWTVKNLYGVGYRLERVE